MRNLTELEMEPRRKNPFSPVTDDNVQRFQAMFNIVLPEEYVQFLKHMNGGRAKCSEYSDPCGGTGSVNDFYGLGSRVVDFELAAVDPYTWEYGNLWGEMRIRKGDFPNGVPFARDGGDNQLFLDFTSAPPCVSRRIASTGNIYKIANSFAEFLDMLHDELETW